MLTYVMGMVSARSILEITGEDCIHFLQGLLTQDVSKLAEARIQFAALLSPQGKILHDMFLVAHGDAILIDTPSLYASTLLKRLMMYKLRAKVSIRALPELQMSLVPADTKDALPDPRHASLPWRLYDTHHSPFTIHHSPFPDSTTDFAPDEITAMDAGYDLLNAISFTKGCYVGQEIVARMHYKAIVRKGFFIVSAAQDFSAGDIVREGKTISTVRHVEGKSGLALLRFEDGLNPALATVDNQPVTLTAPDWMQPKIAAFLHAQNA